MAACSVLRWTPLSADRSRAHGDVFRDDAATPWGEELATGD